MSVITQKEAIDHVLNRGVEAVYPSLEAVQERLSEGNRLRFYLGVDPTSPTLHIGHALQMRKLAQLQALGHEVILLIGSFTAMIGDPTDKSAARTQLTRKEVLANAATYKKQASKILRFTGKNAAKIMFNDKWLAKMSFEDVIGLASHFTVQQMLERDMFEKRMTEGKPIHLHEFFYPLMQGYDSVAMDVDGEIGGSDQIFNMLAGRTLMKQMSKKTDKMVIASKLLVNDEGKKMSKSEGGFIAIQDAPEDMYGKLMAMDDSMILPYFELVTDVSMEEIDGMKVQMDNGVNPRDIKMRLAKEVVTLFHDSDAAQAAEQHFVQIFQKGSVPEDMETFSITQEWNIIDLLVETTLAGSKSEARRFIDQGGVKIDGNPVATYDLVITADSVGDGLVLQRGKRQYRKLI